MVSALIPYHPTVLRLSRAFPWYLRTTLSWGTPSSRPTCCCISLTVLSGGRLSVVVLPVGNLTYTSTVFVAIILSGLIRTVLTLSESMFDSKPDIFVYIYARVHIYLYEPITECIFKTQILAVLKLDSIEQRTITRSVQMGKRNSNRTLLALMHILRQNPTQLNPSLNEILSCWWK